MSWEKVQIIDVVVKKISGEWGNEGLSKDAVNILRTTNFTSNGEISFANVVKREIDQKKIDQKKLQIGDLIIEKSGGGPKQPVGRVVYFDREDSEIYLCNNFTTILRPDRKKINPRYFFYAMFNHYNIGTVQNYQNKTVGIINLKLDRYLTENIPLPDLKIQQQIVTVLDKAQKVIRKRDQSLQLLDDFLKVTFLDMFGAPDTKERFKLKQLKSGITLVGGYAFKSTDFKDKGVPLIKIGTVNKGYFDTSSFSKLPYDYLSKYAKYIVISGDLLITLTGTVGKDDFANVCFADSSNESYLLNQRVAKFEIDESKYNRHFLAFLFKHPITKRMLQKKSKGVRQANISNTNIETLELIYPPISEQNNFGSIVNKVEISLQKHSESKNIVDNLFQSLLQDAFAGKIKFIADKVKLNTALDRLQWFEEQTKEITQNSAVAKLQAQMRAVNKMSASLTAAEKLNEMTKVLPMFNEIEKFQNKMNAAYRISSLQNVKSLEIIKRLEKDEFIKKITDNQSFRLKSYEEFSQAKKENELKEELRKENDPVLLYINEKRIGNFTLANYKVNVARAINELFNGKEFSLNSLREMLIENHSITVSITTLKKDIFHLFEQFIQIEYSNLFALNEMRIQMKQKLFNPSFELLQEYIENALKSNTISQVYTNREEFFAKQKKKKISEEMIDKIKRDYENRMYLYLIPTNENK